VPEILHVIGSKALGGAERWFLRLAEALQARGAPSHAIVRRGSELDVPGLVPVPYTALPLRTVWDPISKYEVIREVRRLAPDIVQTYMGRATRLTRIPPGRGPVHVARLGGYYKLDGYRHAHAWIGNTRGVCDYMIQGGLPADRVFHIYNFLDPPALRPEAEIAALRDSLGVGPDEWVLMTPGRFVPVKGHRYLLDALARLPAEIGGRRLRQVMLGDGRLTEDLHRQAREEGIADRIVWAGWQSDPGPWYQLADLVVFPSLERETFGNVVLEAWTYAKPLVTTDFRGAIEYTHHGEDVFRVPCEDPQALAEGIHTVLSEPELAAALARRGNERARKDFGREPVVRQYLDLYERLASREN
jgi:glycosyltransferase involved in cell wall biosynthesis